MMRPPEPVEPASQDTPISGRVGDGLTTPAVNLSKEALNKSILDFSAPAIGKARFPMAHTISSLWPLILAAPPWLRETLTSVFP